MNKAKLIYLAGIFAVITAILFAFTACESEKDSTSDDYFASNGIDSEARNDNSSSSDISIDPDSAGINRVGQKVTFNVAGGKKPYTWSVENTSNGNVSPTETSDEVEAVVYTASVIAENTVIVKDSEGRQTRGLITKSTGSLAVSPATLDIDWATVTNNTQYSFIASGGSTPYSRWSVSHPGNFSYAESSDKQTCVLTLNSKAPSNTVVTLTVVDALNTTAKAQLTFK